MSWFCYEVYGLKIQVDRQCLYLPETEGAPDVVIQAGDVACDLSELKETGVCYSLNETECVLNIETIARFHVMEGTRITYQVEVGIEWSTVCLYLYKAVLSILLSQRKVFVLHAAAVVKEPHDAVLLMGSAGVGKSALAARLIQEGYRLISDELSAIRFIKGVPYVCPGPRVQKLWSDSCEQLMIGTKDLVKPSNGINRYCIDVVDAVPACSRVKHVVSLDCGTDWARETISGAEKVNVLNHHMHHRQFICGLEMKKAHLESVLVMASSVQCFGVKRLPRSVNPDLLYNLVAPFLTADLESTSKSSE